MTTGKEFDEGGVLTSAASIGSFMAAVADGTLADMADDDVSQMVEAASASPETVAALLGAPDEAASIPKDVLSHRMMGMYYDECAARDLEDADLSAEAEASSFGDRRMSAMMECSDIGPEVSGRVMFDADHGDESPFTAIREKFYFG